MASWNEFEIRIAVRAPITSVYLAWTAPRQIEGWFLRQADFTTREGIKRLPDEPFEKGDRYKWLWHGYKDDVFESNRVLNANGVDFIRFEFTGKSIVSVNLETAQAATLVTLRQERIPDDPNPATNLFVACQMGWVFYLTNLKSVMEGGIDLRNRDTSMTPVVNS